MWIMEGFFFLIHCTNLCLLLVDFNPLTCKVITDEEGFTGAILLFFSGFLIPFSPHLLHFCLVLYLIFEAYHFGSSHFFLYIFIKYFLSGYHENYN